jgi:hypothetical protein
MIAREAVARCPMKCELCLQEIGIDERCVYCWLGDDTSNDLEVFHQGCADMIEVHYLKMPRMVWRKGQYRTYQYATSGFHDYDIIYHKGGDLWCCFKDRLIFFTVTNAALRVNRFRDTAKGARSRANEQAWLDTPNEYGNLESYKKSLAKRLRWFYIRRALRAAALAVRKDDEGLFAKEHIMAAARSSRATPAAAQPAPAPSPVAAAEPAPAPAPKKDRVSLSEEEIQQAIEGVLNPRDVQGTADQEGLTKLDERGRPAGRPIGINTGLPILGAWALAFQENEKLPAQNPQAPTEEESLIAGLGHAPDSAITAFMKAEFPGRQTPAFDHPQGCRNDFNNGKFTKGMKPKWTSNRYDDNGTVVPPGRRGTDAGAAPAEPPAPAPAAPAPAPAAPARRAAAPKAPAAPAPAPAAPARRAPAPAPAAPAQPARRAPARAATK